jgi:hypothetical protein
VRSNDKAPEKLSSMLLMTAVCLRPKDRELYEIGVSHNSLTYAAREPEARDTEELAAEMNLVLTTFRFE